MGTKFVTGRNLSDVFGQYHFKPIQRFCFYYFVVIFTCQSDSKILYTTLSSKNSAVCYIAIRSLDTANSTMSANRFYIYDKYDIDKSKLSYGYVSNYVLQRVDSINKECLSEANVIKEFIIHPCDPTVVICYLIRPCGMAVCITYLVSHSSSLTYNLRIFQFGCIINTKLPSCDNIIRTSLGFPSFGLVLPSTSCENLMMYGGLYQHTRVVLYIYAV